MASRRRAAPPPPDPRPAAAPWFRLRGTLQGGSPGVPGLRQVRLARSRRVTIPDSTRDTAQPQGLDVATDDVVRIEYDGGLVQWIRADDLLRERGSKAAARGDGSADEWAIDPAPAGAEASRGLLAMGIQALDIFGVDLAGHTARSLGRALEQRQLQGGGGLWRLRLDRPFELMPPDGPPSGPVPAVTPGRPMLLWLHGTASSTRGSFGELWADGPGDAATRARQVRQALAARYGDQVWAFEHPTLTESPIANALALAQQLPDGAILHLVSHSRGGLVGELLCLGQRTGSGGQVLTDAHLADLFAADHGGADPLGLASLSDEQARAREQAYADDRARLAQLVDVLDRKRLQVARFVRVACPARGTTLASGRLDRWLSLVGALVPAGPGDLLGDAADFLLAVVKERTDPRTLPGLEAMMPGSALTRLLAHPDLVTAADLSVIAGDIEPEGPWGRLKLLAADWFYGSEHDLVVNSGSMSGGLRRLPGGARGRLDRGQRVHHFNYFRNPTSLQWLCSALLRADGDDAGFQPLSEAPSEPPRWRSALARSPTAPTSRPLAVVIPGTMGSALAVRDRPVWLDYGALIRGGLGDIGIEASDVTPTDLLDRFYGPLVEHLTRSHRVAVFPYDWRVSVRASAARLAEWLSHELPAQERSGQPVHLVAHSMGGLVARAMIAAGGAGTAVWQRIQALPDSRLLMLGTPNHGSHEAVRWLVGHHPTLARLILLDFTRGPHGVIDIVRRFPGLVELLPFDQMPSPWSQPATWRRLRAELGAGFPLVEASVLREAARTWALLRAAAPDPERMVYVAGCQPATVIGHALEDEPLFGHPPPLRWQATREGDGTVSWASGQLPGVRTWYAPDTAHDELCARTDDPRLLRAYVDLLQTGRTNQLPEQPPVRSRDRAGSQPFVLPPQPLADALPDERAVQALGFGGTRPHRIAGSRTAARRSALQVTIRHGNLAYARFPVMVGHYQGDTIVSAEAALDRRLAGPLPQGPLTRERDLGLYPGAAGTHAVFFNERPRREPQGAVVIGLGGFGELSPGRLEAGVRDAVLAYAVRLLERRSVERVPAPGRLSAGLSALLIGSGTGGLPVNDSIGAILRGVLGANRRLESRQLDTQVLIDELEFIELYQDVALAAAEALRVLGDAPDLVEGFSWSPPIVGAGQGGRQRVRFDSDPAWWQRIEIVEDRRSELLRFTVVNDRARAEETLGAGQLALADQFIRQACTSTRHDPDVARTLFEMLLPLRLREAAPDQRDTVLLLDEASARFPWELLENRWSGRDEPQAVVTGLVRQLKTVEFRAAPSHAASASLLVVGDPDLAGWRAFAPLAGARREAQEVHQVLVEGGFQGDLLLGASAAEILSGLHRSGARVLHLAGHGAHDFDLGDDGDGQIAREAPVLPDLDGPDGQPPRQPPSKRKVSGMVIGPRTFLTAADIQQLRHVPELVFINCCHLGQTGGGDWQYHRLAANLGVELIRMGARAVVCAGWAVDDEAAVTFARAFYRRLCEGSSFGEAVKSARRATWRDHPGANTWGAYQCYGDPDYRLLRNAAAPARTTAPPPFHSPEELITELCNLAEGARMTTLEDQDSEATVQQDLHRRIEALLERMPQALRGQPGDWTARSRVAAAVGFAYGEAGLHALAAEWLDRAWRTSDGDCPLKVLEQLANVRVRQAVHEARVRSTRGQGPALKARILAAIRDLQTLHEQVPTYERSCLLGSAWKRWAMCASGSERRAALGQMEHHYRRALQTEGREQDLYAFTNAAAAQILLQRPGTDSAAGRALAGRIDALRDATGQALALAPTFWITVGLADLAILRVLLARDDDADVERIAAEASELFQAALSRGASLRERASVPDTMDFLLAVVSTSPRYRGRAVVRALESVRAAL